MHCYTCVAVALGMSLSPLLGQTPPPAVDREALTKLLLQYDKNKDGKVEKAEYPRSAAAFANLDRDQSGAIDEADFTVLPPRGQRPARGREPEDASKLPKVGELAPDFELPLLGMKDKTVKLSSFRGDRPVALIFGSYT